MKCFQKIFVGAALVLCSSACFCSCSGGISVQNNGETQISVCTWNLQTFFDGKKDGCEYKEFQKSSNWNNEAYKVRLERLCQFISETSADIYIFEELENKEIIYDISNQLAGAGYNWNQKKFWNYSAFAKQEGTAIGIGILSRFPIENVKTHFMDIRIHKTTQPSTRYLIEAEVNIEKKKLVIFANHWKSKSGGEEETEIWRDWQESILAKRLTKLLYDDTTCQPGILICGDFNRDAQDFICDFEQDSANTILRCAACGYTDFVAVDSLWFTEDGNFVLPTGSYRYKNQWERIDNIMLAGKVKAESFTPVSSEPLASQQGYPVSYKTYNGSGWSDHLPLLAKIILIE